ncbi:MAG: hypothetical protein AAFX53_16140 [Bacteroidota bacterium]
MRTRYLLPLSLVWLFSCASLQETDIVDRHYPSLGDLGSYDRALLPTDFHKIGSPSLQTPIPVSVREVPFDKAHFKKYMAYKKSRGAEQTLQFSDSLEQKPKYLCLALMDKIALGTALNQPENSEVLRYLEQDSGYRLVHEVALVPNTEQMEWLTGNEPLFLANDANGSLVLQIGTRNALKEVPLSQLELFDYKTLGFCWAMDRYGKKRIAALVDYGEGCPKHTEHKAHKLDKSKNPLRL